MRHPLFSRTAALFFGLAIAFAFANMIFAWTDPSTSAPGGNIAPPINISSSNQTKSGNLNVGTGLSYWITKSGDSFALNNNAGTTKLVIGQDGNVGIGTTGPAVKLHVATDSGGLSQYITTATNDYAAINIGNNYGGAVKWASFGIRTDGSLALGLGSIASPKMVIDTSGNVGIGTTAPINKLSINSTTATLPSQLQVSHGSGDWGIIVKRTAADAGTANFAFLKSRGETATPLVQADSVGRISWHAVTNSNGTTQQLAEIGATNVNFDGTNADGYLYFQTKIQSGTVAERMRIDQSGNVGIGTASPGAKLDVQGQIIGGFGAVETGGVLNWNDSTNSRPGSGYTLLLGNATNGPGPASYFHAFNFEYSSKNGTGSITQIAIPYATPSNAGIYIRGRYQGAWSSWSQIGGGTPSQWTTSGSNIYYTSGNVGIGTTGPAAKLTVNGVGANYGNGIRITDGGSHYWEMVHDGGTGFTLGYDGTDKFVVNRGGNSWFSSGNVGIGTTSPDNKLDVNGILEVGSGARGAQLISTASDNFILMSQTNTPNTNWNIGSGNGAGSLDTAKPYITSNGYISLMSGNVGIGTTSPGYRLDLGSGTFGFGNSNQRTETRNDAGLQGNAGAQSGFFETSSPTNYPSGASSWWHMIDTRHSNTSNNFALQIAGSFFDQDLYFRKTNNSATTAWNKFVYQNSAGNASVSGSVTAAAFYYNSDAALKENIVPISDGLDKIDELTGTYFNWKDSGSPSMGLIAQDVEKVFPEAVSTNPETGLKSVDYGKLVAPLIEAVKTQQGQIDALKASAIESNNNAKSQQTKIDTLETSGADQQKQIDALKTEINELKSQDSEID